MAKIIEAKNITQQDMYHQFFGIKENPKRYVAKIYKENAGYLKFEKSVVIPTDLYPLYNNDFEVFNNENCTKCEDVRILECFDNVEWNQGHCYQMADDLKAGLMKEGYDAKIYVGWLFVSPDTTPIHHAWVMIGNSLLDLQDDWTTICYNSDNFKGKTIDECRLLLADFHVFCKENNIPNSVRCSPVGIPSSTYYYVGCEVPNGECGREEYRRLLDRYPNHDCASRCINNSGITKTQLITQIKLL